MKVKKQKVISISILFFMILLINACGSTGKLIIAENYMAESYNIEGIEAISTAVSEGSIIYFAGREQGGNGQSLYYFDIDTAREAVKIPYEIKADELVACMSINIEGNLNLAVIENTDAANEGRHPAISIRQINRNGTEISRTLISGDILYDEYIHPQNLLTDADGRIYLNNVNTVYTFDNEGNQINKIMIDGYNPMMSWDDAYENIYITWIGFDANKIARIDPETGFLGQSHDLDGIIYSCGLASYGNDFLIASDTGIHAYNIRNHSLSEIFIWSSVNMAIDIWGTFLPLSNSRFGWIENKQMDKRVDFQVIRELNEGEELPGKETLVVGGGVFFMNAPLRAAVAEFNAGNPRYRVDILDYGIEDEDIIRFNMDIVTGKAPDIIILPRRMSMELYAAIGALSDLYLFIDEDNDMERDDFKENIIKAYEVDGQLFGIPLTFGINTVIVPQSEVSNINGWNLDEMMDYVNSQLPGREVFTKHSKTDVLKFCLRANGDALVDWSAEGSGFQRDLVLKMLNFANQFTPDHLFTYDDDMLPGRIRNDGQVKIYDTIIFDYYPMHAFCTVLFGEPIAYPGFPSENGNGNLIDSTSILAINQNSRNKGVAWEFIRTMLTEEFQTRGSYIGFSTEFPILKSAYDEQIRRDMEVRNFMEDGVTEKPSVFEWGGFTMEYFRPTEDDIKAVNDLIDSADKIRSFDFQIENIIIEEAGTFFTGAKSAEEAADVAERRIGLYVSELK